MIFNVFKNTVLLFLFVMISCVNFSKGYNQQPATKNSQPTTNNQQPDISVGANQIGAYLPMLHGKRVGIVANQTSVIFKNARDSIFEVYPDGSEEFSHIQTNDKLHTHIIDSLLSLNINITNVFAPEHGFRGTADAGEHIKDGLDIKTGIPIISLYSGNKKPKLEQLKETENYESDINRGVYKIDVMVFDLQDVGARFYTYISTLHYVMEACAEANIPLIILDRPNPNGHYIDGAILETENKSFVGMHPIPVVYGMTIGEYAQMINGEKWLANGIQCNLTVIPIKNYTHKTPYSLPIKPSPNLPNDQAINLYPSLCFFEGTNVSAGRGTNTQFQVFGSPFLKNETFKFTFIPESNEGAKYPKHQDKLCFGKNLTTIEPLNSLKLNWLIEAYQSTSNKNDFFNKFFIKLAGTQKLQQQIVSGFSEKEIKETWKEGLDSFRKTRVKYLLYN